MASCNLITTGAPTLFQITSGATSSSYQIDLPTAAGSANTCLQYGGSGSQLQWGACGSGATGLAKNTADSSSAAASSSSYLYQFTNSGSAVAFRRPTALTNGTNTNSTLDATASGNPGTNQAVIYGSDTNATPSGNLLLLQSGSGATSILTVNAAGSVLIGSNSGASTSQDVLQLNSYDTFADSPSTCAATTNQGAIYYNNVTNTIRACLNSSWQDLVSTQALSTYLFGVVPNSGNNPGDLIGSSATSTASSNTGGPCKVNWASTTSVYVNACLAYSGGREVSVAAQAVSIIRSSHQQLPAHMRWWHQRCSSAIW